MRDDDEFDYAAEMARYSDTEVARLLGMAEELAADLAEDGEEWPNVTGHLHRLRDEQARRVTQGAPPAAEHAAGAES
jgi:hypothetical protein